MPFFAPPPCFFAVNMTRSPRRIVSRRLLVAVCSFVLLTVASDPSSAWAQRSTDSPERAFADAVQLYEQRLYPQAATSFEQFRRAHPQHPNAAQALYFEAKSALATNHEDEAIRLFQRLESQYPTHPKAREARLSLGQYFLEAGDTERGRAQLERIVAEDGDSEQAARALYLLGRDARERGQHEQALGFFRRVVEQFPEADVAPVALYASGTAQVRLERYRDAATSFETLGQRFPNSPYARNVGTALAEVYYELDRYDQAVTELNQRLPDLEGPARVRALFFLAESYNQLGRGEDAVVTYRRILDTHPSSEYVRPSHYGLGWVYFNQNDFRPAARAFADARRGATDSLAMKATYHEAVSHDRLGDRSQAASLYRSLVETWPQSRYADDAQYELGLLQYEREDYSAAAASFRQVVRTYPGSDRVGDAYYWLGNAQLADRELDAALEAYSRAIDRDAAPDSLRHEVQFQKAWALYENGRFDQAAPAFTALSESAARHQRGRDALFWAADSHFQSGRLDRARQLLLRYTDRYPDGRHAAAAQYALGWTYFKQQRYEPAARAFQRFLQDYRGADAGIPYRQDARLRLADCYYAMKRYDDAVETYRRVDGEGADYALFQTGQALNFAGRPDEAVRTLRRLVDRYPDSRWREEALYRIGYVHFQQQDYAAAREAYREVIQRYPDDALAAQAQYGIGDAYYNAGDMNQAVTAYRRVLERHPDSPTATEAASSLFFALSALGQDDRAQSVIDSIAAANPDADIVDELRFRRAETAYQSGATDRALGLFQQFVRTSSNASLLPEAYYYLGVIYADRDQPTEARNYLRQLVDRFPNSDRRGEAALRLGDLNLDREQYESALDAYRSAAESPRVDEALQAQARYGQSVALLQLGRPNEAEQLLQGILDETRSGPLQASAQLGLARIYERQGRVGDATRLYQTVVDEATSETGAEALYRLGTLLRTQGDPREAVRELDRMPTLFAGYPEWVARALLEQARAYRQMGQTGQASQLYDQVIEEHSGTRFAQTARQEKDAL